MKPIHLVLVDNDEYNIAVVNGIAGKMNLELSIISSHDDCDPMMRASEIDIIILNIKRMSDECIEIIRTIQDRRARPILPMIILTPTNRVSEAIRTYGIYTIDVVYEPVKTEILQLKLRMLLDLITSEHRLAEQVRQLQSLDELNKKMRRKIQEIAFYDDLTGIPNRRHLNQELHKYCRQAHRDKEPLSVLMVDLDNFKGFNDYHGHIAGDHALTDVARTIVSCCRRPLDFVGRYGGEEFLVLLPDTDYKGAMAIASSILDGVWNMGIPHCPKCGFQYLSVSIGLVTCVPSTSLQSEQLIDWADQAMYEAKRQGRNQIHTYQNADNSL